MPPFVDVVPLGTPANVFLKCYLRGIQGVGVGWDRRFSLVSLMLLHMLFLSFVAVANQKLARL